MLYKAKVNIHLNQHWNERYQMSGTTKKKKKNIDKLTQVYQRH